MILNEINYTIRNSKKAKRILIKILPDAKVELVVPIGASVNKAKQFINSKQHWINSRLTKMALDSCASISDDSSVIIFAQRYKLLHCQKYIPQLFQFEDSELLISKHLNKPDIKIMLKAYLLSILKEYIRPMCEEYCLALGVKYKKISLKDTKGQWGSCSARGNLSFSWRLVFAPKDVVKYLVVHEVSHLVQRNHSSKFWAVVENLYPEYKSPQRWLKRNGSMLHSIRF